MTYINLPERVSSIERQLGVFAAYLRTQQGNPKVQVFEQRMTRLGQKMSSLEEELRLTGNA